MFEIDKENVLFLEMRKQINIKVNVEEYHGLLVSFRLSLFISKYINQMLFVLYGLVCVSANKTPTVVTYLKLLVKS